MDLITSESNSLIKKHDTENDNSSLLKQKEIFKNLLRKDTLK